MRNPYKILGVPDQADDDIIRKAWLVKVRQYPPETASEKFKLISQAYEQIKTRKDRIRHFLFSTDSYVDSPLEALTSETSDISSRHVPAPEELQKTILHLFHSVYIKGKR
ncbi:MAG TPA: J domain-containing protein [Chitinispirillaceae bacterium]|nr:J domain-containing protein [Chitinispirillaceae bacterium]